MSQASQYRYKITEPDREYLFNRISSGLEFDLPHKQIIDEILGSEESQDGQSRCYYDYAQTILSVIAENSFDTACDIESSSALFPYALTRFNKQTDVSPNQLMYLGLSEAVANARRYGINEKGMEWFESKLNDIMQSVISSSDPIKNFNAINVKIELVNSLSEEFIKTKNQPIPAINPLSGMPTYYNQFIENLSAPSERDVFLKKCSILTLKMAGWNEIPDRTKDEIIHGMIRKAAIYQLPVAMMVALDISPEFDYFDPISGVAANIGKIGNQNYQSQLKWIMESLDNAVFSYYHQRDQLDNIKTEFKGDHSSFII